MSITRRSSPYASPACGGTPYWNAVRRNPNCSCACSGVNPSTSNILLWISGLKIRTLPPPISFPFKVISYAFARTLPGSLSMYWRSSSIGIVNGWCIAVKRFCSSLHSRSGNSVIHINLYSFLSKRSIWRASSRRSAPNTSHTTLFLSAAKRSRSPFSPSIAWIKFFCSSSVMNFAKEDFTVPSSWIAM